MAGKRKSEPNQKPLEQYEHKDKERLNNPPVGLVDAHTDNGGQRKRTYAYDPHLPPELQWAGKAEHTSFDVPTVSLHVHERIDPRRVIEAVRKQPEKGGQESLFELDRKPLREAIEFYKHKENWTNRLIAGDSLLVMNSLLEKEGMGGKLQMVYIDPPYGIKYGSNFQPFVNKRDVKDGKDEDLTAEPEMIKAFRDTWELGIHSYLAYLRDRLLLARELLSESGSVFVQISDENVHLVRNLMDEVMGVDNFSAQITFAKTSGFAASGLPSVGDYLVWYAKNLSNLKFRPLFVRRSVKTISEQFKFLEQESGEIISLNKQQIAGREEIPAGRRFAANDITSPGESTERYDVTFNGRKYWPNSGTHWRTTKAGIERLRSLNRLFSVGDRIAWKRYEEDFPYVQLNNNWPDTAQGGMAMDKVYVVQTVETTIERCLLMTTDPGDLVLDITCGSGTTAYVAEQWGRRWITCDTSRVATALAKQRLMTGSFDYYELAHPAEGVGSGFKYKIVPHVTLKSIANNEPAAQETLYDQPVIDSKRLRVTGPFTVEAVPAPFAKSFDEVEGGSQEADASIARAGETLRQSEWRDELLKSGVRAKGGRMIHFTRVEPLSGTRCLQAEAETKEDEPKRALVCFGPEHAPLDCRMVEAALEEAEHLKPKAPMILFCAFQFDEEAAKDIDETAWPGVTLLKAQMNTDLQTDDLKKKRASNESFWLIGQPDVTIKEITDGEAAGKYQVEVNGFDYYNPKTGNVESGGKGDIAAWMLDHDYDGRSLLPSQVFFPMAGAKEGWATLARNLKAVIDDEKIESFGGTVSLPFKPGKAVAVKIIDARGIESLKIIRL